MERKKGRELLRRWLFFVLGLLVMAFGVAFSIKGNLGTSPISSVPYVISLFTPLTVGQVTICMHCVFVAVQILLLRKKYEPLQLLQLPVAAVFGYMTDFALWTMRSLSPGSYAGRLLLCAAGIVLVGVGVSMEVKAKAVVLAGEGVILAICRVTSVKFPKMKVIFDVTLVVIALAVSLLALGRVEGVREGTVAAALCVGFVVRLVNKPMEKIEKQLLTL